jgi:uncharacterized membrane protein
MTALFWVALLTASWTCFTEIVRGLLAILVPPELVQNDLCECSICMQSTALVCCAERHRRA